MKKIIAAILIAGSCYCSYAQNIGINSGGIAPNAAALLDLNTGNTFTSPNGLGFLIPNVALSSVTDVTTIASPPRSLLVYVPLGSGLTPPGYYYNSGNTAVPNWTMFSVSSGLTWLTTGNAGTTVGTNFLGTTDGNALEFKVNSLESGWIDYVSPYNTFFGYQAGIATTTGAGNTAFGYEALLSNVGGNSNTATGKFALYKNTTGSANTATGDSALYANTTGEYNTASGYQSMFSNQTGSFNCALGYVSFDDNTSGNDNVGMGVSALHSNTVGDRNTGVGGTVMADNKAASGITVVGDAAMFYITNTTTAYNNYDVAIGHHALESSGTTANNTGTNNTALGAEVLNTNTSGSNNSTTGDSALYSNTTGSNNTCYGQLALNSNIAGSSNLACGYNAGCNSTAAQNVFAGDSAGNLNTAGRKNTFIGYRCGLSAIAAASGFTNVSSIGYVAQMKAVNCVNLGNLAVTAIYAQVTGITGYSDRRVKDDIKDNIPGLEFISKLKPVTFKYNIHRENKLLGINDTKDYPGKYDIEKITQSGFIAQQVDSTAIECHYDFSGIDKPRNSQSLYGLNYTAFVVSLVKAMQQLSKQNDSLKAANRILRAHIEEQNTLQPQVNAELEKEIAELKKLLNTTIAKAN
jgi:hypothetical protein